MKTRQRSKPEPISAALNRLRLASGMTVADLAGKAGVNRTALHRIEAWHRKPSWDMLLAVATAMATALGASLGAFEGCKSGR